MPRRQERGPITARQRQVLRLIWEGLTARKIGRRMHLSHRTVEVHKKALLMRSGCRNTAQLLRWAIETGLLDIADGKYKGGASTP